MKNIIIGTSCYSNCKHCNMVSITGDGGNAWGFYGNSYKKLALSLKLYEYYINNPDCISDIELIEYYIKEYYLHRLKELNIEDLLYTLKEKFGQNIILLCHELPNNILSREFFCHRRIVADYIELTTGIVIPEIMYTDQIKRIETFDYKKLIKKLF